jgi:hypothetical protein
MPKFSFKITPSEPIPDIFHFQFENQYILCSTLIRPQEFYESHDKRIRNKYFTFDDIMDSYVKYHGEFNYFNLWAGFNLTSDVIKRFYNVFHIKHKALNTKEKLFFDMLDKFCPDWHDRKFCIIATYKGGETRSVFPHEIAHALYFLDESYRSEMNSLIDSLTCRKSIINKLRKMGYGTPCLIDEVQAYLSTSSNKYLTSQFKLVKASETSRPFKNAFKRYRSNRNLVAQ